MHAPAVQRQPLVARAKARLLGHAAAQHHFDGQAAPAVPRSGPRADAQTLCELGRVFMHLHTLRHEQRLKWQILRAVHPGLQVRCPTTARERLQHGQQVGLGHRAARATLPQAAHHRVQRGSLRFTAGRLAQAQIHAQRHQRALGVVAHRGVGGVFVLAVVLHPRIKAGLRHALHFTAGRLHHLVDGFVQ